MSLQRHVMFLDSHAHGKKERSCLITFIIVHFSIPRSLSTFTVVANHGLEVFPGLFKLLFLNTRNRRNHCRRIAS